MDLLGHQVAMHLRAASAHLRRRSNLAFAPFGMTTDQYVVLTVLTEQGEATQQELVRRCSSDTATMGAMLSLLEDKGLITRSPHPRDGRARSVKLTRKGKALAGEMWRGSSEVRTGLASHFTEAELRALIGFLDRLVGAMPPPRRKRDASPSQRTPRRPAAQTLPKSP
jgi:DNA-binding MarR family transcriptional regulator